MYLLTSLYFLSYLLTYLITYFLLSELVKQSVSYVRAKYLSKFTIGVMCLSAPDVVILVKWRQYYCGACSVFMLPADCI